MLSTVLILPADQVDTGNAVAEAMGWGPSNYSIPLSANGRVPVTHYGLHTWATDSFRDMIEAGYYPPELEQAGIDEKTFAAMTAALVSSFWPDYTDHFATVIKESGLQQIEVADV
jgi:hypothetical protein